LVKNKHLAKIALVTIGIILLFYVMTSVLIFKTARVLNYSYLNYDKTSTRIHNVYYVIGYVARDVRNSRARQSWYNRALEIYTKPAVMVLESWTTSPSETHEKYVMLKTIVLVELKTEFTHLEIWDLMPNPPPDVFYDVEVYNNDLAKHFSIGFDEKNKLCLIE
jgi:hypothetical protein